MRLTKILIAALTLMICHSSIADNQKNAKKAIPTHIQSNLLLHEHDDYGTRFKKLFPKTRVYKVRMKQENGWSGLGMSAIVHNGKTKIISDDIKLRNHIISLFKKPLKNKNDIENFFNAIGDIDEIVPKGKSTYHIYTGDKFFGQKSGYRLVLNSDKTIKKCEYELKLSK